MDSGRESVRPPRSLAVRAGTVLLCAGLAMACLPAVEKKSALAFNAKTLDAIDAAMERLAAGRWPSWSMEVDRDHLAFRVETRAREAVPGTCREIKRVVRESADAPLSWSADITRGGRIVAHCTAEAAPPRRSRSKLG